MELPEKLKHLAPILEKCEIPRVKINATPIRLKPFTDDLGSRKSKFLGCPHFPAGMEWPTDQAGNPMLPAVQINFGEIPGLAGFPESGILQLFFSAENWMEEQQIVFHPATELNKPVITDFSFLLDINREFFPIHATHILDFAKGTDFFALEDEVFLTRLKETGGTLSESERSALYDFVDASGHKLSGYAEFTQGDPRSYENEKATDIQLLQIDSEDEIMWGDVGLAHLFIDAEALKNQDFSKAWFYWDCA